MGDFKNWLFSEKKKVIPPVHHDIDKWLGSVDNLKKELEKLKAKVKDTTLKKKPEEKKADEKPEEEEKSPEEKPEEEKPEDIMKKPEDIMKKPEEEEEKSIANEKGFERPSLVPRRP